MLQELRLNEKLTLEEDKEGRRKEEAATGGIHHTAIVRHDRAGLSHSL